MSQQVVDKLRAESHEQLVKRAIKYIAVVKSHQATIVQFELETQTLQKSIKSLTLRNEELTTSNQHNLAALDSLTQEHATLSSRSAKLESKLREMIREKREQQKKILSSDDISSEVKAQLETLQLENKKLKSFIKQEQLSKQGPSEAVHDIFEKVAGSASNNGDNISVIASTVLNNAFSDLNSWFYGGKNSATPQHEDHKLLKSGQNQVQLQEARRVGEPDGGIIDDIPPIIAQDTDPAVSLNFENIPQTPQKINSVDNINESESAMDMLSIFSSPNGPNESQSASHLHHHQLESSSTLGDFDSLTNLMSSPAHTTAMTSHQLPGDFSSHQQHTLDLFRDSFKTPQKPLQSSSNKNGIHGDNNVSQAQSYHELQELYNDLKNTHNSNIMLKDNEINRLKQQIISLNTHQSDLSSPSSLSTNPIQPNDLDISFSTSLSTPTHVDVKKRIKSLTSDLDTLTAENKTIYNEINTVTQLNNELNAKLEDKNAIIADYQHKLTTLQQQLQIAQEQYSNLSQSASTANEMNENQFLDVQQQVLSLSSTNAQLSEELQRLNTENFALSEELSALAENYTRSTEELQRLYTDNTHLQEQIDQYNAELAKIEKYDEYVAEVTKLNAEMVALNDTLSQKSTECRDLEVQIVLLNQDITQCNEMLSTVQSTHANILKQKDDLIEELSQKCIQADQHHNDGVERENENQLTISELKLQLSEKDTTIMTKQAEINELNAQIIAKEEECEIYQKSIQSLQNDNSSTQSRILELTSAMTEMDTSINDYKLKVIEGDKIIQQHRDLVHEKDAYIINLKEQLSVMTSLQQQSDDNDSNANSELLDKVNTYLAEITELKNENTILENKITQLRNDSVTTTQFMTELTTERDSLSSEIMKLQSAFADSQQQLSALTLSEVALRRQIDDVSSEELRAQEQIAQLQNDKTELNLQITNLTQTNNALQSQFDEVTFTNTTLISQLETLSTQIVELKSSIAQLNADKESLESHLATINSGSNESNAQLIALREQLDTILSQKTALTNELTELQSQNAQIIGEKDAIQQHLDGIIAEKDSIQQHLDDILAEKDQLQEKIDELTNNNLSLSQDLNERQEQLTSTQDVFDTIVAEKSLLSAQIESFQQQITTLEDSKNSLSEQLSQREQLINELSTSIQSSLTEQSTFQQKINAIEASRRDLQDGFDILTADNVELTSKIDALTVELTQKSKEYLQLQLEINQDKEQLKSLTYELMTSREQTKQYQLSASTVEKKFLSLQHEFENLNTTYQHLIDIDLVEYQQQIDTLNEKNISLQTLITTKYQPDIDKLNNDIIIYTTELSSLEVLKEQKESCEVDLLRLQGIIADFEHKQLQQDEFVTTIHEPLKQQYSELLKKYQQLERDFDMKKTELAKIVPSLEDEISRLTHKITTLESLDHFSPTDRAHLQSSIIRYCVSHGEDHDILFPVIAGILKFDQATKDNVKQQRITYKKQHENALDAVAATTVNTWSSWLNAGQNYLSSTMNSLQQQNDALSPNIQDDHQ